MLLVRVNWSQLSSGRVRECCVLCLGREGRGVGIAQPEACPVVVAMEPAGCGQQRAGLSSTFSSRGRFGVVDKHSEPGALRISGSEEYSEAGEVLLGPLGI